MSINLGSYFDCVPLMLSVCLSVCTYSHIYVIPGFTWTLSLGILLAQMVIQPITSLLTLLKGIMLIITVSVFRFNKSSWDSDPLHNVANYVYHSLHSKRNWMYFITGIF